MTRYMNKMVCRLRIIFVSVIYLYEKSVISQFFKQYDISFVENNNINLLYKNVVVNISDAKYEDFNSNIKFRLETDYCINGFAFREGLEKKLLLFSFISRA